MAFVVCVLSWSEFVPHVAILTFVHTVVWSAAPFEVVAQLLAVLCLRHLLSLHFSLEVSVGVSSSLLILSSAV